MIGTAVDLILSKTNEVLHTKQILLSTDSTMYVKISAVRDNIPYITLKLTKYLKTDLKELGDG